MLSVTDIFLFRQGFLPVQPAFIIVPLTILSIILFRGNFISLMVLRTNSAFFFLTLFILSILFSWNSNSEDVFFYIGLSLMSLLIYQSSYLFFTKINKAYIINIFLLSFIVLGLSIAFELLYSKDLLTRGSGFAENPNGAAFRLSLLAILILKFTKNRYTNIMVIIGLLVFTFMTLSRSGLIMAFLVVTLHLIARFKASKYHLNPRSIFNINILFLVILFFSSLSQNFIEKIPGFNTRAAIERIEQLKGNREFISASDKESGGRVRILKDYFQFFTENPYGYGTGTSSNRGFYSKATHNTFLRLGIDFGLVGILLLFVFFYKSIFIKYSRIDTHWLIFFLIVIISCFFTNTLLENRTFIICLSCIDSNRHGLQVHRISS